MQIQRIGKLGDTFSKELSKRISKEATIESLPPPEKRLEEDRKDKAQAPFDKTTEGNLESEPVANREPSKDIPQQLPEKNLAESRAAEKPAAVNASAQGITETRLNNAKTTAYPHRNEEAYRRTGEKRPVNALPEEMGDASDEGERKRFNEACKAGEKRKRILDEDVGKQLTLDHPKVNAFNLGREKLAACGEYLAYKASKIGASDKFAEVREVDAKIEAALKVAQAENRHLSQDEAKKVAGLKAQKAELLGLTQKRTAP